MQVWCTISKYIYRKVPSLCGRVNYTNLIPLGLEVNDVTFRLRQWINDPFLSLFRTFGIVNSSLRKLIIIFTLVYFTLNSEKQLHTRLLPSKLTFVFIFDQTTNFLLLSTLLGTVKSLLSQKRTLHGNPYFSSPVTRCLRDFRCYSCFLLIFYLLL